HLGADAIEQAPNIVGIRGVAVWPILARRITPSQRGAVAILRVHVGTGAAVAGGALGTETADVVVRGRVGVPVVRRAAYVGHERAIQVGIEPAVGEAARIERGVDGSAGGRLDVVVERRLFHVRQRVDEPGAALIAPVAVVPEIGPAARRQRALVVVGVVDTGERQLLQVVGAFGPLGG